MKKLISVLLSIGLLNIILLGVAQGSVKSSSEIDPLNLLLSKYEKDINSEKAELLKVEELLTSLRLLVLQSEQMVNQIHGKDLELANDHLKTAKDHLLTIELAAEKTRANILMNEELFDELKKAIDILTDLQNDFNKLDDVDKKEEL